MNHTAKEQNPARSIVTFLVLSLVFVYLVTRGEVLGQAAYDSLSFAASRLIPSMFLFAVFSKIAAALPLVSEKRGFRIMGYPLAALPALCIGLFTGFPMGAYAAKGLLDHGVLDEKRASHLAAFANNASLGFLLFTVAPLFGDPDAGWRLFSVGTVASLTVGALLAPKKAEPTVITPAETRPFFSLFCDAVASSAAAMLTLTGYLTLFGVIAEALRLSSLPLPVITALLLLSEPCAAMRHLATFPLPIALPLAAFSLGFSGLSILLQSMTVWQNRLPFWRLVTTRLMIGILAAFLTVLSLKIL